MFTFKVPKSVLASITCAMVALPLVPATSEASPASRTARRVGTAMNRTIKARWTVEHAAEAMMAGFRLGLRDR